MNKGALWFINNIEKYIACILLSIIVVASFAGVVSRYVIGNALMWSEELCRYCSIWMAYLAGSHAVLKGRHVTVDILTQAKRINPKAKKVIKWIAEFAWLAFCIVMVYLGYQSTMKSFTGNEISAALKIPKWIVYAACPVGLGAMGIRLIQQMILKLMKKPHIMTDTGWTSGNDVPETLSEF